MAAWADKSERFVEIPGIVEIRWVSDDPDYYVAPIDLFDEQKNGLPDFYGKKDKTTTEQAFFTCNLCECDLKSVVTLRAHCKGTQHIRKALQKKSEYRKKYSKREPKVEVKTEGFRTLFEWLDQGTSEAVVGLENITEYLSGRERDEPYYHCNLEHCRDEQGEAETMKNHMLTARHKQAWLEKKTGSFLKHQTEISQRIAEFTKDFRRDFRDMKVVEDREMWMKAKEGKIRIERIDRIKTEKSYKREESSGSRREENYRREYEERGDLNKFDRRERYQDDDRDNSYNYDRERGDRYDRKRRYEEDSGDNRRRDEEFRSFKYERDHGYSYQMERNPVDDRDERGWRSNERVKSELVEFEDARSRNDQVERVRRSPMRDEIEEVSRSGNFQNWRTATVKVDTDPSIATTSSKPVSTTTNKEKSVSEEVDRLHRKVANKVMKSLNKYYPGAEEFDPNNHKIGSPDEYTRLAKQFSHQLRRKIKESYEAYNSTLEGIQLTGDHEQFIRTEVESHFENVSRIS